MDKIGLKAILEDSAFQAGLARYVAGLGKANQATKTSASFLTGLGHTMSTAIGTAIGMLTSQAIPALVSGLGSFVTEAMAAEQTDAQLEAVLKSTGGVAGVTSAAINDMANALSEVTPFEDDAIKGGQSLLLTFTNIGKNVFPDATETMLDMSQALGQDLKSSAIQLGKALQDPTQGVSALQRVGVNFTDAQKKMIEQMVKAGKTEQAQRFILKELKTEFGGAAKAAGTTFAGQMKVLQNQIGNVKEEVGTALLPILKRFTGFISSNILPVIKRFASEYMPKIVSGLSLVSDAFGRILQGFQGNWNPFIQFIDQAFGRTAANNIGQFINAVGGVATAIGQIFNAFKTSGLAGGLQALGTQLSNAFKNVDWTAVSQNLDSLKTRFWTWLTGPGGVLETVGTQLGTVVAAIGGWVSDKKNTQPIVDAVLGWVEQFWTWLTDPKRGLIITVAEQMGKLTEEIRRWSELPETQQQFMDIGETVARTILDGIGLLFANPAGSNGENPMWTLVKSLGRGAAAQAATIANLGSSIGTSLVNAIARAMTGQDLAPQLTDWLRSSLRRALLLMGGPWAILAGQLFAAPASNPGPTLPWGGTGEKYGGGGPVRRTGMALVHAGEYVLNRQQAMAWAPVLTSPNNSRTYNFYHTWPGAVAPSQREWTESMVRRVTQEEVRGILREG